jgi:hypothetical protein
MCSTLHCITAAVVAAVQVIEASDQVAQNVKQYALIDVCEVRNNQCLLCCASLEHTVARASCTDWVSIDVRCQTLRSVCVVLQQLAHNSHNATAFQTRVWR